MLDLQLGNIIVTRNETDNPTPGWYNHAAIVGVQAIVEAQAGPAKVIASDLEEFVNRYPIIVVLRLKQEEFRDEVGCRAMDLIGVPYRAISSLFALPRHERYGMNCVSVVRRAVQDATGEDPRWRIPDDVARSELLETVGVKGV